MRIAYVIGTFSAHPVVMGAMNEFLRWVVQPATSEAVRRKRSVAVENGFVQPMKPSPTPLPVRVMNLGTMWTVLFKEPGRYNWLLQYYLRAEGVTLSWVGTGRCLSSLDFAADDYGNCRPSCSTRRSDEERWMVAERRRTPRAGRVACERVWSGKWRRASAGSKAADQLLRGDHAAQEGRPSRLAQQSRSTSSFTC